MNNRHLLVNPLLAAHVDSVNVVGGAARTQTGAYCACAKFEERAVFVYVHIAHVHITCS